MPTGHYAFFFMHMYAYRMRVRTDGRGRGRGTERNGGHRSREAGYKHLPITRAHHYLSRRVVHVLAGALSFFLTGAHGEIYRRRCRQERFTTPVRVNDVQLGANKVEHCYCNLRTYTSPRERERERERGREKADGEDYRAMWRERHHRCSYAEMFMGDITRAELNSQIPLANSWLSCCSMMVRNRR